MLPPSATGRTKNNLVCEICAKYAKFDRDKLLHLNLSRFHGGLRNGRILLASSFIFVACLLGAISFAKQAGSGWSIVASPNAIGSGQSIASNQLNSVTCISATNCWAVGVYYNVNGIGQTLAEQWNGSSWTIVPSPNSTKQSNGLNGVTCTSQSQCWAVGYSYGGSGSQVLIERWDGTSWTITSVNGLPAEANYSYFQSVACPSASQCWAVGYSLDIDGGPGGLGLYRTLIAQWNGSSWTVVLSPNTDAIESNLLNSVACTSATNCWAVGYSYSPNDPQVYQSLIERWNGISWAIVPSPTVNGSTSNYLASVTCASTTDCWAVGAYVNGYARTLIEHWNGSSWVVVVSPNVITTENNVLNGVACTSASECWVVGYYVPEVNTSRTLIEQWNGTAWSIVASPNVPSPSTGIAEYNSLNQVICNSANNCWAVGNYEDPYSVGPAQTLIESNRPSLQILSITHPANNTIHLQCQGVPNAVNRIEFSSDLSPGSFNSSVSINVNATGSFSYDDTNAGTKKFYRIAYP
jgi:hypothetical protein